MTGALVVAGAGALGLLVRSIGVIVTMVLERQRVRHVRLGGFVVELDSSAPGPEDAGRRDARHRASRTGRHDRVLKRGG